MVRKAMMSELTLVGAAKGMSGERLPRQPSAMMTGSS
jgi:hypothetical protein